MEIRLDHIIVPSHNRVAAAKSLAGLLDVPWRELGPGGFAPVYVSETLTLDFADREQFVARPGGGRRLRGSRERIEHACELQTENKKPENLHPTFSALARRRGRWGVRAQGIPEVQFLQRHLDEIAV